MTQPGAAHLTSPDGGAQPVDAAEMLELLAQLGVAMAVSGEAPSLIRDSLQKIAAYGQPMRSNMLPTMILIETGEADSTRVAIAGAVGRYYRFDQIAEVYAVLSEADRGAIAPADGLDRLRSLRDMPPRFSTAVRIVGHALLQSGWA